MTWDIILQRVLDFLIHVDHETGDIHVYDPPRKRWLKKKPNTNTKSGRPRIVISDYKGKGRGRGAKRHVMTVYVHKLVWIYFNRRLPVMPIDHKDLDRHNNYPSNLREMSWRTSNRQGLECQRRAVGLGEAGDFFDNIAAGFPNG